MALHVLPPMEESQNLGDIKETAEVAQKLKEQGH